jgi:HTH-type transcriptional regulator, sugar sensing transcriptional regulator
MKTTSPGRPKQSPRLRATRKTSPTSVSKAASKAPLRAGARATGKRTSPHAGLGTDLVAELQSLGFSDYEARTYITLLHCSPATAYEVSRRSGLPRSNTYDALESCTKKGAVQPVSQAPVRYAPVDPRVLLTRIVDDTSARCARLACQLAEMKIDESPDFVWTIDGEKKVNAKISEIIRLAKRHIWIKAHQSLLDEHSAEMRDAAARGVSILIILFGDDAERFRFGVNARVYLHEGNGIRVGNADNLFTITADFNTALTAKMHGEVHAAHTSNESIVTMAESFIRHDLYLAEIFQRFGPQIDAAFGPFLASLRRRYFSPEQLVGLEQTLDRLFPANGSGPKPGTGTDR